MWRFPSILTRLAIILLVLSPALQAEEFTGKVVRVSDGDTIRVLHDQRELKIRLFGVDAPESKQAFGNKAKQKASELEFGKVVTVQVKATYRYGRTVAEVILPDGTSRNRELVRSGYAGWYHHYCADATLGQLEAQARGAKIGLWADPNPIEPWAFRRDQRDEDHVAAPPAAVVPGGVTIIGLLPGIPRARTKVMSRLIPSGCWNCPDLHSTDLFKWIRYGVAANHRASPGIA